MSPVKNPSKVVVTGLGTITPLGVGSTTLWEGLLAGRSGIRPLTGPEYAGHPVRIAGTDR